MNACATAGQVQSVCVLLIDDDYDIRMSMREVLEDEGFTVATASHGAEAIEVLRTVAPSVILLDLNMPIMNGIQFREAQKAEPLLNRIPTIVMTAVDRMKERLGDMAPDGALAKPIKLTELMSIVRRYCKHGKTLQTTTEAS